MPGERITRSLFKEALRLLASRLTSANAGHLNVDDLTGLPRFDPTHPPGPVLQRLIEANILESLPGQPDKIRFSVAAVQDFFQAEADIEEIRNDPGGVAERYFRLPFTSAYPRLARLGYRVVCEEVREEFVGRLTELDARMAAIVLRACPASFSPEVRGRIVVELGNQISALHRVRASMAITLLGELDCHESSEMLATRVLPPAEIHSHLKSTAATAFLKLGHVPAASFVYQWKQFGIRSNGENHFSKETLVAMRGSPARFRIALADEAIHRLASATGTREHEKAVTVLAYLGDCRLIEHLEARLTQNGLLDRHENYALMALGNSASGELFERSVLAVGGKLTRLPNDIAHHDARNKLIRLVIFPFSEIRYFITREFEPHLKNLIEDDNTDVSWIASDLAKRGRQSRLLYSVILAAVRRRGWRHSFDGNERNCITANLWMDWWRQSIDTTARRGLLTLLPPYPNVEVESILMDSLDSPELRGLAARGLGEYGTVRSAALLRGMLSESTMDGQKQENYELVHALGDLRDEFAVPLLEKIATENLDYDVVHEAVTSLGLIGSLESESALERLLQREGKAEDEEMVLEALLLCGSERAMSMLVSRARSRLDGVVWLCERINGLSSARGWRRGEYYTHIQTEELVRYIDSQELPGSPEQRHRIGEAVEQIDSPSIRELLKKWAILRGSEQDLLVTDDGRQRLSDICYSELRDRGDESAIEYTLDEWSNEQKNFVYVSLTSDHLRPFPPASVAERIRLRLSAATTASETVRMLSLLGQFGEAIDADLANRLQDHPDDLVANVACETVLRLSDPLLVPDRWREL